MSPIQVARPEAYLHELLEGNRVCVSALVTSDGRTDRVRVTDLRAPIGPVGRAIAGGELTLRVEPSVVAARLGSAVGRVRAVDLVYSVGPSAVLPESPEGRVNLFTRAAGSGAGLANLDMETAIQLPPDALGFITLGFDVTLDDGTTRRLASADTNIRVGGSTCGTLRYTAEAADTPAIEGTLQAGGTLGIEVDPASLKAQLGTEEMPELTAFVLMRESEGEYPVETPLNLRDEHGRLRQDAVARAEVPIPFKSRGLHVWIRARASDGREVYLRGREFAVAGPPPDADPAWRREALSLCPRLDEATFRALGPSDFRYNCLSHCVGVYDRRLWPAGAADFTPNAAIERELASLGYERMKDGDDPSKAALIVTGTYRDPGCGQPKFINALHTVKVVPGGFESKLCAKGPLIFHETVQQVFGRDCGDSIISLWRRRVS